MQVEKKVKENMLKTPIDELQGIFEYIEGINPNIKQNDATVKKLFDIHNRFFPDPEYGYHCSTCRAKVWRRVNKLKPIFESDKY
jgi:hypothetical protein